MEKTTKFQQVKDLLDGGKNPQEVADELGTTKGTVITIRNAIKKGFRTHYEHRNYYAQKAGYQDWNTYNQIRKILRNGEEIHYHFPEQKLFEDSINIKDSKTLKKHAKKNSLTLSKDYRGGTFDEERLSELQELIEKLPEMERETIKRIFFDGETQENIGQQYDLTRSRVEQIKIEAIARLKRLVETGKGEKALYSNEELLMTYILSKSDYSRREIANVVNYCWHEGRSMRTRNDIMQVIEERKRKIETVRDK